MDRPKGAAGGRTIGRRVEAGRLRPLLPTAAAVTVTVILVSALAGAVHGNAAPHRAVLDFLDPDRQAALGRRVVAVEAELAAARHRGDDRGLAVLLGQSTVREGLDAALLEAELDELRWLNLGASGGSFLQLRFYSEPLLESALHPHVVVLGVHAQWLADPAAQIAGQRVRIASRGPGRALEALWAWRERNTVRILASVWLGRARNRWLGAARQPLAVRLPPGRGIGFSDDGRAPESVWSAPRKYVTRHAPAVRQAEMRQLAADYGWFRPAAYHHGAETDALDDLVARLHARAELLIVVLMPERDDLRQQVPPEAVTLLAETVDRASKGEARRIDHREAIADERFFFDWAHLNAEGRQRYCALLAADLAPILTEVRPLPHDLS